MQVYTNISYFVIHIHIHELCKLSQVISKASSWVSQFGEKFPFAAIILLQLNMQTYFLIFIFLTDKKGNTLLFAFVIYTIYLPADPFWPRLRSLSFEALVISFHYIALLSLLAFVLFSNIYMYLFFFCCCPLISSSPPRRTSPRRPARCSRFSSRISRIFSPQENRLLRQFSECLLGFNGIY